MRKLVEELLAETKADVSPTVEKAVFLVATQSACEILIERHDKKLKDEQLMYEIIDEFAIETVETETHFSAILMVDSVETYPIESVRRDGDLLVVRQDGETKRYLPNGVQI